MPVGEGPSQSWCARYKGWGICMDRLPFPRGNPGGFVLAGRAAYPARTRFLFAERNRGKSGLKGAVCPLENPPKSALSPDFRLGKPLRLGATITHLGSPYQGLVTLAGIVTCFLLGTTLSG